MRETVFKKALSLLLCAVMLLGVLPLDGHAEDAGLTGEQRQAVVNRQMDSWYFPLPEEFFDDIVEFAGCRGSNADALYGISNDSCTQDDHASLPYGSEALIVDVPSGEQVFAPASGSVYHSSQPDPQWADVAVVEVPADSGFSYYLLLGGVSADAEGYVEAGTPIGFTSGTFRFGALMDYSGMGSQIADDLSRELSFVGSMGWLIDSTGTGLVCVNPSASTNTAYPNSLVNSHSGPISYRFVPMSSIPEPPEETLHVEHTWDGGTVVQEATGTDAGILRYTCTVCGETRDESIPPLVTEHTHAFDQMVTDGYYLASSATCISPALYYYSCSCGERGTETFAVGEADGAHSWDGGRVIQEATGTDAGILRYTCTVCNATRDESIPPLVTEHTHAFDQMVTTDTYLVSAATCASPAIYHYSCSCGEKGTETFTVGEASGDHAWDEGTVTLEATHTTQGNRHHTCTVCDAQYDEPIPPIAEHVFDQMVTTDTYLASAATCSGPALYYYSCSCGEKGTETFEYGNPAPHTYSDQWSHNDTDHWRVATCGHSGEVTDFGPHRWDDGKVLKDAGHNTDGQKLYTCTTCYATKTEAIPGQPHEYNQPVAQEKYLASAATCTSPASYYYSCVCGEKGTETFAVGTAKGHTYSDKWSSNELQHWHAATCEHTGEKIDAADHVWNPGQITTQPTATTKGVMTYTCSICGATKTEEVPPTQHEHTFSANWSGNSTYHWHPATCEHTNVVNGLGEHSWNEGVVTEWPSHTANGKKVFSCTVCGMQKTETLTQTHTYNQQIASSAYLASNATCTSPATYYYSCTCGAKDTTKTFTSGTALGHSASGVYGKDANYHWYVCSRCGAKGELTAHSLNGSGVCTVCGYSKEESHIHSSHLSRVPAKAATCTQEGSTAYYICDCGKWFTDVTTTSEITDQQSVVIPALGHVDADNNGRCDVCRERLDNTVEYQMTEGSESTWLNTSDQGLVFRTNAEYSKFDHVEVDGATVAVTNYSVSEGSTIVELNAGYLKRLSLGRHTISIVAKDGRASSGFTIKQGAAAGTSGGSNAVWGVILFLTVIIAIAIPVVVGILYYRKRMNDYN